MNIDNDNLKNLEEIDNKRMELEEAIFSIELKLEEVKINQMTMGVIPNTAWLYRAKHALGCKKLELKKLNIEREKLKRLIKAESKEQVQVRTKCFERNFLNAAKEILLPEEFIKIKTLANELTDNQNGNNTVKETEVNQMKNGTAWSKEDIEYLKENYKNATIEELSLTLGRSENSIRSKIQVIKKKCK
ncbi:hypothetical protein [Clostridium culturomicium]|uniref:hypothetical protein n=1 Tax=Clostridium culturomicium TaxID=1499683 RepID=UPI00385756AA